ncbi:hypothetical protein N7492_004940 [Penicillium capsulatum]|uniref:Mitochondrial respiratory complex I chaperone n=1 Tax=Penicillium capsulatum TaxID=69766 RepID=A0A9W9LQN9_9EURO|nr:hypothetical protein N7492_004940 [Penicillium capsulatum]KAJ6135953.1 hypothetical protein N7512_001113 [Penicillium capsulatum]
MQSQLTRRVFRAIINNEPLRFPQCRRNQLLHTISPARTRPPLPRLAHASRRTLFAFNPNPSAGEGQPATLPSEKGLQAMTDLKRSLQHKDRSPPTHTLAKAFQAFFATRVETPGVINLYQARLLSITWKHMKAQQDELDESDWLDMFSVENLERMLVVLSEVEILPEARTTILKVARFAYLELCADHGHDANTISRPALLVYIKLLASNGSHDEARHVIWKFANLLDRARPSPWLMVLKGYAMHGDHRQLRNITRELEAHGKKFDQASHEALLEMLIAQGSFAAVQAAYQCPITGNSQPSLATKSAVIKYALLKSQTAWAKPIFESLKPTPHQDTTGVTLLWEAAQGTDADSLAKKIMSWSPELQSSLTMTDFNNLIQYANSVQMPQQAEGFAKLADKMGLIPDERTHLLLLESAIEAGNVEQTLKILETQVDPHSLASENLPVANKLITMLCLSDKKDALFQQISTLLDPLFQENVPLESKTVAALTRMLLYRHDWEAVSDLLRPRLGIYDHEGKVLIRDAITGFIMDLQQSDEDAWDVYELFRLAFSDSGVAVRSELMASFFKRKRSDLGVLVFGHMRQAEDIRRRPKPDTYARCFQGLAQTADLDNVELVHNMLKLDLEVTYNTRIMNAMMLAYAACDKTEKSMDIFRQILQSDEGPSDATIPVFFKVCEKHHDGAQEALKMMTKVKKLGITMNRRLYGAYIEALAAQCEFDLAKEAIDNLEKEIGVSPNSTIIGLFYNAIPYQYWKDQVEEWAQQQYPAHWEHLQKKPRSEHEEGLKFDGITNDVWV